MAGAGGVEGAGHATPARVGDRDGHGQFGVLDDSPDGLLCHECGERFAHLGLHAFKAHGKTAAQYRKDHGLTRRGLVTAATREAIAQNARASLAGKATFLDRRDPAKATAVRLETGFELSPAGKETIRQARVERNRAGRLGTVVTCQRCGLQFCPLRGARRRRFCSRSCASKYNRARRVR